MRILVFGKNGQLGHAICAQSSSNDGADEWIAHGREQTDLSSPGAAYASLDRIKPDLIINAAAYTAVDQAEAEPEVAHQVNAKSVRDMGRWAKNHGAALVHVSTDYVFDGRASVPYCESAETGPLNEYGRSKLAGEVALLEDEAPALIARTAWVYSLRRTSFVNTMLRLARERPELSVVDDQVGNPTWCVALARGIGQLVQVLRPDPARVAAERRGIYHLAGQGVASRYQLVQTLLKLGRDSHGLTTETLHPVSSDSFPAPAPRPLFTALAQQRVHTAFGIRLPDWQDSLAEALSTQVA